MRTQAVGKNFAATLESYWVKPVFQSTLKNVRKDFLEAAGFTTITGVPYVVVCLLLATTVDRLVAGYSGSYSYDDSLLHEAIGIGAFYAYSSPRVSVGARYDSLVQVVGHLQTTNKDFFEFVDQFIGYDNRTSVKS